MNNFFAVGLVIFNSQVDAKLCFKLIKDLPCQQDGRVTQNCKDRCAKLCGANAICSGPGTPKNPPFCVCMRNAQDCNVDPKC